MRVRIRQVDSRPVHLFARLLPQMRSVVHSSGRLRCLLGEPIRLVVSGYARVRPDFVEAGVGALQSSGAQQLHYLVEDFSVLAFLKPAGPVHQLLDVLQTAQAVGVDGEVHGLWGDVKCCKDGTQLCLVVVEGAPHAP